MTLPPPPLHGRCGLILGLGQAHGLAWQVARAAHVQGARLVLSCVDRAAHQAMLPLAARLGLPLLVCDPGRPGALPALLAQALELLADDGQEPELDFAVHATAWAPLGELRGHATHQAADAFLQALRIACHSFAELAQRCAPHMPGGGALVSLSQPDADDAWRHPGLMAPVTAALSSTVRYLAHDLAPQQIRVHALAPQTGHGRQPSTLVLADEVDTCLALLAQAPRRLWARPSAQQVPSLVPPRRASSAAF